MSPLTSLRLRPRTLLFVSVCIVLVAIVSAWASRQQASSSSRHNASTQTSVVGFAPEKVGVTPAAATITVNSLSDVASASDGLCTLREAITAANNNAASGGVAGECAAGSSSSTDTIAFSVTGTINLTGVLPDIASDMTITGPGSNQLTVKRNTSDFYRIFNVASGVVSISGMTVTNGNPSGSAKGGGIQNLATLSLTDLAISSNQSGTGGGAGGGGIYNQGILVMTNTSVTGNSTPNAAAPKNGGGIANEGSLSTNNCIVNNNQTGNGTGANGGYGGGIFNSGAITLVSTSVSNNVTGTSDVNLGGLGGGIYNNTASSASLLNCTVANNNTGFGPGAKGYGGGINTATPMTITGSTISGNTGNINGVPSGGISNDVSVTLINSTISGNHGNGIQNTNSGAAVTLTNCTVTLNDGVGVAATFHGTARNSLFAGNIGNDVDGFFTSNGHNLVGNKGLSTGFVNGSNGDQVGTSGSPIDARLGALANNGGPTMTHALLLNSPALDAGDDCVADVAHCGDANISQLLTDQRGTGFSRKLDGPDADAIATVDIGAFEAEVFIDDITDKSMNKNTQLQFSFNVGGSIASVTATSSNTTLVPNNSANLAVSGSGSSRTLTISPATNQIGTSTITVTVNGTSGASMSDTFVLTVNGGANTPSVTNATTNEDVQTSSGLVISRNAIDGAEVTHFKISNITNGTLFKNDGATAINNGDFITFAEGNAGLKFTPAANLNSSSSTFSFQVQSALDSSGGGLSGAATASITVNAVNDPPTFTKGANPTVSEDAGAQAFANFVTNVSAGPANESGQTITLTVTNDNNALFSSQPAVAANGTLTFTAQADANGSATVTITVKDDGGTANGGNDTASQTFTITVNSVNDAPSFVKGADQTVNNNAGPQTVANWATNISPGPGNESTQTVSFQVTGNTNAALFTTAPAVSSSGTLTYTPSTTGGGTATISIVAKDNGGTANGGVDTSAPQSFTITVTPVGGFVKFASSTGNTTENSGSTTIDVVRTGDTTKAITVNYATNADAGVPCSTANGIASPKCDFTAALGTLTFAANETSKPITILIGQDSFVEGPETITLTLSSPTGGSALGTPSSMTVTIADDPTEPPTNMIDDAGTFVRMHYHDFLNRQADQSGLDFWTGQMTNCGNSDLTVCRVNVSGAFFLSIEFQQTGYLVERMYKTAYGDATAISQVGGSHQIFVPVVRANEFLTDTQRVGRGVIVNQGDWQTQLENNKQAYALEFVQTSRFMTAFPTTLTPPAFVDKLNQNAGNVLSPSERATAISLFGPPPAGGDTNNITARAQVLRQVAEDADLYNAEFNRAFVLTQYIGYLRRNPNDAPDSDYSGYDFWLGKLNQFNGDYIKAEMVKAFIASDEYRHRFGP